MPAKKHQQQMNIKFIVKLKKISTKTLNLLCEVYREDK